MNQHGTEIPSDAKALAQEGKLIEAIKITREQTGIGLKEAKDAVEAYLADPQAKSRMKRPNARYKSAGIPVQAILFLEEGRLIDAIKLTREALHLELKPAKETVWSYLKQNPDLHSRYKAASAAEQKRILTKLATIGVLLGSIGLILLRLMQKH
ncbi:ribosomal protein L7/L12 [Synechococcus sp. CS-1328]|uniref:ribosomal protein L7/L12 n=1 Tax=Synechococcus sp. CS-1328 TaxID=2847976 RepID=UPI00223C0BB2|nr:ribosomal protein L7/L12 [Synechococcus sp. CS-1328]MCT0224243.1 ribosomal protein L7/L12 [Synechococcus sp. CS-1328]